MSELYQLYFPQSNKSYIGITDQTALKRYAGHKKVANSKKFLLYNAWRKYGDPKLIVLAVLEHNELAETEIRAISIFNTLAPNGYNLSLGGDLPPNRNPVTARKISEALRGRKLSQETKDKIGAKSKGRKKSPEARKKLSEARKGKHHSQKTKELIWANKSEDGKAASIANFQLRPKKCSEAAKEKLRAANIGKKVNEETKKKISDTLRGRKLSKEHTDKLRLVNTGKHLSEETKQKLREANLGKKHSPETIAKQKASMKAMWVRKKDLRSDS